MARAGLGGGDVRPAGEPAPLFEREVEEGGQHLGGELDRHPIDPIEGLAHRQGVEDRRWAVRMRRLEGREIGGPETIELTVLRWGSCLGGSMAMKLGSWKPHPCRRQ